jgi:hypothetical protein
LTIEQESEGFGHPLALLEDQPRIMTIESYACALGARNWI